MVGGLGGKLHAEHLGKEGTQDGNEGKCNAQRARSPVPWAQRSEG